MKKRGLAASGLLSGLLWGGTLAAEPPDPVSVGQAHTRPDAARCVDRSGIRWVLPFAEALKRAKAEGRLLLVKQIAGGTDDAGGW